jgi:acyl-CoA synthetase (AMP-forming)/AMP-acid ligase II
LARSDLQGRWYAEGWYGTDTFADVLRSGAAQHAAAQLHFVGPGHERSASLAEVVAEGERVAAGLDARGVVEGDVIAVQVPNWVEGAVSYAAAMMLGAVLVPIVHIYGPAEVGFILRQSRARVFVVPDRWRNIDYLGRLRALTDVAALEEVVVIGDAVPADAISWDELAAQPAGVTASPGATADDAALLVYTSGTTGEPKGVLHSHNTLLAELRASETALPGVSLGAFPAGHIAGVLSLLRCFVSGSSVVMLDAWDPAIAAAAVERFGVQSTAGTPYFLTSLVEAADRAGHDISSLRSFMVGAASVPPSVVRMASERGIGAYRAYGSTEHPTVTTGVAIESDDERATTDGSPTAGNELRIVDDAERDVPAGERGEILTLGPEQFLGYSDPRHDAEAFTDDGWFRTGDIGVFAHGHLTIVDRKKDLIIRGGENISSKEVEDVLILHPSIADVAVVAAPDPKLGEVVCAFVVLHSDATIDLAGVGEHFIAAGVARQKTPERLVVVDELPRGPGGKVQKVELRARLAAVAGGRADDAGPC